jgi:hypothetical protein
MSAGKVLLPALLGVALAGCGATPLDYTSDRELNDRPGMFSGEKGAFVIRVGEGARPAPTASEYEEFQRWKNSPEQAGEQREFQEWREWQQYREWKKRQGK